MNRIDRLTAILIQIQGKPRVPMKEMEERFAVSKRTIFRDIKSLIEAGVPIGGDAREGYFIVDGYHLPPVVFSKEEAAALLTGAKLLEKNADSQLANIFSEAMFKIKAVLRCKDKEFLDTLESSISVIGSPMRINDTFPDSHLADIQLALASQKVIQMEYHSNYNDTTSGREVEPLGLVYYSGRWHLIAYCRLRADLRDFRTDRIQNLKILPDSFDPLRHPNYLDFTRGVLSQTNSNEAVVRFTKNTSRFVQEQKYYYGFVKEQEVDGEVEMKFITPHYGYLARWLLMYGDQVTIIAPNELKGLAATYSQELFEHHKKYFIEDQDQ